MRKVRKNNNQGYLRNDVVRTSLMSHFLLLPHTEKMVTMPPKVYAPEGYACCQPPLMDSRFTVIIALALVFYLFPTSSGAGQEFTQFSGDESHWPNPFPGLGNVSPPTNPFLATPQARTLYATENSGTPELSPTPKSGELYLARLPSSRRTGVFQRVNFNTLWVPNSGSKGLGMTELDLSAMFALPMPTPKSPLLLTPRFSTTFFNTKDHSATFYATGLNMRWIRPIFEEKLTADIGFNVLYSGDFRVRASDAMRFPAHIAGVWNFNPRTKIVFGVVYSDRRDRYNWFPMGGLIWAPHEDVSIELLVPRVRIAQRIRWFDTSMESVPADWLYTAFEFGGGSWGHETEGRIEYRDFRLLMGYERRTRFGSTLGLEVGYMFDREMHNSHASVRPSDSVFLRFRSSF